MASTTTPGVGVWKNIPFGNAPRFQSATPRTPWSGVLNTTAYGPGCPNVCDFPQPEITCPQQTSEDCLNLNIFSPDPSGSKGGLPVLFWIPGGRFQFGGGSCELYSSDFLCADQNVVVVTINYRLGAFGALTTANGIKGNFNLQDQRLALQWVQQNVAQFGGDPRRVTIQGESAGAMSVGSHMASPLSKGLFVAAAMSSNPYGLPFQDVRTAQMLGKNFLDKAGCSGLASAAAEVQCLQGVDVNTLLNISNSDKIFPWPSEIAVDIVPWTPTVDPSSGELPVQPLEAAATGTFVSPVPILLGNNANDSLLFISGVSAKPMSELEVDAVLVAYFGISNTFSIKEMYPKPSNPDGRVFLSRVMTDYLFTCPNRYVAAQAAKNQMVPAYFYLFNHLPSFVSWLWSNDPGYAICGEGPGYICHATDLVFTFALNKNPNAMKVSPPWSAGDAQTTMIMSSMFGSFAQTGATPNVTGWTPLSQSDYLRYNVQPPTSGVIKDYHNTYCDFYDKIGYSRRGW